MAAPPPRSKIDSAFLFSQRPARSHPDVIRFNQFSLSRGTKPLFEETSFTLNPGEKAGLVGANGAGKSTLFSVLRGELHADGGDFAMPPSWRIAHVAQEAPAVDRIALDYTLDGDTNLRAIEARIARAFADADGYTAPARAETLLLGLGFTREQTREPVASFSGGWRLRLNLAQALMCPSDLLLLDEPTNHLDLETRHALTMALAQFEGTLILVSHDRHLLRATTDTFMLVAKHRLSLFDGDLNDYRDWLLQHAADTRNGEPSAFYRIVNRGKRALTLDLESEQGRAKLIELARDADLLVESFRPSVMARLGVGYDVLCVANPKLVRLLCDHGLRRRRPLRRQGRARSELHRVCGRARSARVARQRADRAEFPVGGFSSWRICWAARPPP